MSLQEIIKKHNKFLGPINIAEFMTLALYHEQFGYYSRQTNIGAESDFITSSQVSQMFGEMIALWFIDLWKKLGQPKSVQFIELGPGTGQHMSDMMKVIQNKSPEFYKEISIHFVELSSSLKKKQSDTLDSQKVEWHKSLHSVASGFSFIFANEFFDALPIRQFVKNEAQWYERCISWSEVNSSFEFIQQKTSACLPLDANPELQNAQSGDIFEISTVAENYMKDISERIRENSGAALIIDYGYDKPILQNTFQGIRNHQKTSVLESVGDVDLSSHVNFPLLKKIATQDGCKPWGPVDQGQWLRDLGIEKRAEILKKSCSNQDQKDYIDWSIKKLIDEEEMGTLFKVMAISETDKVNILTGF